MFGKNILSIVGLLFMGSQLIGKTYADGECTITLTLPSTCTVSNCGLGYYRVSGDDDNSGTSYSIGTDKTIKKFVQVTGENSCAEVTPENACGGNIGKLAEISAGGGDRKRDFEDVKLCLSDTTPVDFASDGSFLTDTNAIFGSSGNWIVKAKENKFNFIPKSANTRYLVKDEANIIDTSGKTVIIKDNAVDEESMNYEYNYCVDDNMVVWDRKADLCNGSKKGECDYYVCKDGNCRRNPYNLVKNEERSNGICDLAEPDENCLDDTYYLIANGDTDMTKISDTGDDTYDLIKCFTDVDISTGDATKKCETPDTIPTGYLINSGKGESGTAVYIKCVNDACTPEASISEGSISGINEGINMISINGGDLLGVEKADNKYIAIVKDSVGNVLVTQINEGYYITTGSLVQNTSSGDLYNCADDGDISKCDKITTLPIGYLVNAGNGSSNKPYIVCTAADPEGSPAAQCKAQALESCDVSKSATDDFGKLYDSGSGIIKICGVENDGAEFIIDGTGKPTENVEFFVSVTTKGLFGVKERTKFNIVLKYDKDEGSIIVDKTQIRYRYTLLDKTTIHPRSTAHSESGSGGICQFAAGTNAYEYKLANWDGATDGLTVGVAYYVDESFTDADKTIEP